MAAADPAAAAYMQATIFPTLVPALEALLAKVDAGGPHVDPLDFVASYLMRRNPKEALSAPESEFAGTPEEQDAARRIQARIRGKASRKAALVDLDGDGVITAEEIAAADLSDDEKEELEEALEAAVDAGGEGLTAAATAEVLAVVETSNEAMAAMVDEGGLFDEFTGTDAEVAGATKIQSTFRGRQSRK